jgi:hypothetical protein
MSLRGDCGELALFLAPGRVVRGRRADDAGESDLPASPRALSGMDIIARLTD